MKKMFELRKATTNVGTRERKKIKSSITFGNGDVFDELIERFETKEKALNELAKYKTVIDKIFGNVGSWYGIEEYFVQEVEFDGDNYIYVDLLEFSEMEIKVEDDNGEEHIFDNYEDAEIFYDKQENGYFPLR